MYNCFTTVSLPIYSHCSNIYLYSQHRVISKGEVVTKRSMHQQSDLPLSSESHLTQAWIMNSQPWSSAIHLAKYQRYLVLSVDWVWYNIRKFIGNHLCSTSYRDKCSECYRVPAYMYIWDNQTIYIAAITMSTHLKWMKELHLGAPTSILASTSPRYTCWVILLLCNSYQ